MGLNWCTQSEVLENAVLRSIFGSKMEEMRGGWRNLYKGDVHSSFT
jgi:hypothetical protein